MLFSDPNVTVVDTQEYNPIPHRAEWANLSVPQLIDIKNRLIGYSNGMLYDSTTQRKSLEQGIEYIDRLILTPK